MKQKIYVTALWFQQREIEAYCLGDQCGKGIFSFLVDEYLGALITCPCDTCPFLDAQLDEPIGEANGVPVILRKLRPLEVEVQS